VARAARGGHGHANRPTGSNSIGRITTSGTVTTYPAADINVIDLANEITSGPDGALWFTNYGNSIGRITTSVTPAVSGFTPASGAAGTTVTITGQNLPGATKVAFDGTPATIVSDTATRSSPRCHPAPPPAASP
jgi:hypothetical protein